MYFIQSKKWMAASRHKINTMIFVVLTLISAPLMALSGNNDDPIHIKADRAELDEAQGTAVYQGDVIVTQGSATLSADKITIYSKNQALVKIEAFGSPAHLIQRPDEKTPETQAFGNSIVYLHEQGVIEISDEAKLIQGPNQFQGNTIIYNSKTRVVSASGTPGDKNGRVELIFHPQSAPKFKPDDLKPDHLKNTTAKDDKGTSPAATNSPQETGHTN